MTRFESRSLNDHGLRAFIFSATGLNTFNSHIGLEKESSTLYPEGLATDLAPSAEPAPPIKWIPKSLLLAALFFNPNLHLSHLQYQEMMALTLTAAQTPNPNVGGSFGYQTVLSPGIVPWILGMALNQVIETNQRRPLRVEEANHRAESAEWREIRTAWQLRSGVYSAIFDLAAAQRKAMIAEKIARIQAQIDELLAERARLGALSQSESIAVHALALQAEVDVNDAKNQINNARSALARTIGVPVGDAIIQKYEPELEGRLIPTIAKINVSPLTEVRSIALRSRSDLLGALADFAAADTSWRAEVGKKLPNLTLGPSYQWKSDQNQWQIILSADLPVFNQNEGPIAVALVRRRQCESIIVGLQSSIDSEVSVAFREIYTAKVALQTTQAILAAQRSLVVNSQAGRKYGSIDPLELLRAEIEEARADGKHEDALLRLRLALLALETATERSITGLDES